VNLDRDGGKPVLGVVKLTIQQFFRVDGDSTQREGVTPDITLPNPNGYIKSGERDLDHAIAASKIDPAPHVDWKATWDLPALVAKSAKRVAKSTVFGKITATEQLLAKRRDDTRIPLARAQWDARAKQDQDELEKIAVDVDKLPAVFTVTPIDEPTASTPNDERMKKWRDSVARDPWIEESIAVLGDMTSAK
jgi:carboxyl-terminal processing protease